jgi:redox-sensing transcriptional repressor
MARDRRIFLEVAVVTHTISGPTLRRLPQYFKRLSRLAEEGVAYVTSAELARMLKLDETLVRKDLAVTGFTGKPRVGFAVEELYRHLEAFLGLPCLKEAFLIGAGRLGQALASYAGFERFGLRIVALFDTDPEKVGQMAAGKEILPLWQAPALARKMDVRIAILTVPPQVSQPVADMLVDAGMTAFWNFSSAPLTMPEGVIVQNEDLAESLAVFSHRISQHYPELLKPTALVGTEADEMPVAVE